MARIIYPGFEKEEADTSGNGHNIELGAGERVFNRWTTKSKMSGDQRQVFLHYDIACD